MLLVRRERFTVPRVPKGYLYTVCTVLVYRVYGICLPRVRHLWWWCVAPARRSRSRLRPSSPRGPLPRLCVCGDGVGYIRPMERKNAAHSKGLLHRSSKADTPADRRSAARGGAVSKELSDRLRGRAAPSAGRVDLRAETVLVGEKAGMVTAPEPREVDSSLSRQAQLIPADRRGVLPEDSVRWSIGQRPARKLLVDPRTVCPGRGGRGEQRTQMAVGRSRRGMDPSAGSHRVVEMMTRMGLVGGSTIKLRAPHRAGQCVRRQCRRPWRYRWRKLGI